jgi:hypothetical protein
MRIKLLIRDEKLNIQQSCAKSTGVLEGSREIGELLSGWFFGHSIFFYFVHVQGAHSRLGAGVRVE